jgi:erythromycin esterase-like protein
MSESPTLLAAVRQAAYPLLGAVSDYDPLLERIGEARLVLLGEASHGTHEFYRARAEITGRLIAERGFTALAIEADWPDAYRVNRYVRGEGEDPDAAEALSGFERFPAWMWRNADVLDFIGWLRSYNEEAPPGREAGIYGLDLYSLYRSLAEVLRYLERADPEAAREARRRYACFELFGEDSQGYGAAVSYGLAAP